MVLALLLVALLVPALPVAALNTIVTVTTTDDSTGLCATSGSGACSLRDAVTYANAHSAQNPVIEFQLGLTGTIILTGGTLTLDVSMRINGLGAPLLAVDGNGATVFAINNANNSGVSVTIVGLTIQHGGNGIIVSNADLHLTNSALVSNVPSTGTALDIITFAGGTSTVTVTRCEISGNSGGAIFNEGSLTLVNSTVSGNTGGFGGIRAAKGSATIVSSTISNNAAINGGGISVPAGANASIENTIVAGNTLSGTPADVNGAVTSYGHNLIGNTSGGSGFVASDLINVDPLLGPLQNNGGPTRTQALLAASPALNALPTINGGCPATDQRFFSRPQPADGNCDIGAYELAAITYVDASASAFGFGTLAAPFPTISAGVRNVVGGGTVYVAANNGAFPTYNDHITIDRSVTISGAGAGTTTVDGSHSGTVFTVNAGTTVTLSGLTIQHGMSGDGGGIHTDGDALTLIDSAVRDNAATSSGGGIFIGLGDVHITGSTISGNTATARGAGIFNGGTLTLANSTISGNAASGQDGGGLFSAGATSLVTSTISNNSAGQGGGMLVVGGTVTLQETIVAGNSGFDVDGAVVSQGHNLIGDTSGGRGFVASDLTNVAPLLRPLALNAPGATQTHALSPTSPAIDAGGACPPGIIADQRGAMRAQGNACDIGAYEYAPVTPTLQSAEANVAGQTVLFTGSGFQTGTTATVNGASLPIIVAADGQSFTVTVPAHAAGTVPVVVTNPGAGHTATASLTYASVAALPPPKPTGSSSGNPSPLPGARPTSAPAGGSPNPLPPSR